MVNRKPDIIIALSTTAARPAKQATGIIPIVAVGMADPVADELVASLAQPGGNVTGTTFIGPEPTSERNSRRLTDTLPSTADAIIVSDVAHAALKQMLIPKCQGRAMST